MADVTDADREAAKQLRVTLADISGFWHHASDDSALCVALARHRVETERRLLEGATRFGRNQLQFDVEPHPQTLRRDTHRGPTPPPA